MCLTLFVFVLDVKLKNQSGIPRYIGAAPSNNNLSKYVCSSGEAYVLLWNLPDAPGR